MTSSLVADIQQDHLPVADGYHQAANEKVLRRKRAVEIDVNIPGQGVRTVTIERGATAGVAKIIKAIADQYGSGYANGYSLFNGESMHANLSSCTYCIWSLSFCFSETQ